MSPKKKLPGEMECKSDNHQAMKGAINAPRPAQFRLLNKHSYSIYKIPPRVKPPPLIIYMHSPKIIHIQPQHFMALVQKLTGLSQDKREESVVKKEQFQESVTIDSVVKEELFGENEFSSVFKDDKPLEEEKHDLTALLKDYNQYLVDSPLFNPNPGDFLCCPRSTPMDFTTRVPEF